MATIQIPPMIFRWLCNFSSEVVVNLGVNSWLKRVDLSLVLLAINSFWQHWINTVSHCPDISEIGSSLKKKEWAFYLLLYANVKLTVTLNHKCQVLKTYQLATGLLYTGKPKWQLSSGIWLQPVVLFLIVTHQKLYRV